MPDNTTHEERLKALLYQFVTLYERLADDLQIAARQGAEMAVLVSTFTEQVKKFQGIEREVSYQMSRHVQDATKALTQDMQKEASRVIEQAMGQLAQRAEKAAYVLGTYQKEIISTPWKIILVGAFTSILTSVLLFWLCIPTPTLPLTNTQLDDMHRGQFVKEVWSKFSAEEKARWQQLLNEADQR